MSSPSPSPTAEQRRVSQTPLVLRELSPDQVVKGVWTDTGFLADEVTPYGQMRETCPQCGLPLQLVLRHQNVLRTHLYCSSCTRCFDACFPTGRSALSPENAPIY